MQIRALCSVALACASLTPSAQAQTTAPDRPLSAIEWLDRVPQSQPVVLVPDEPDVTSGANVPQISVATLDGPAAKVIGLVPPAVSGLPRDLWGGSDAANLVSVIADMPALTLPAAQSVLFTLLLAEADPSGGESGLLDLGRVDALLKTGALDPALALLEQIGPARDPKVARRFVDASLLNETEEAACAFINATPFLAPDYTYRIFCAARAGDWNTAALLLGTARALGAVEPIQSAVLERFLDPDLFEEEPPLPRPERPNALMFRMYEALGQPISTRSWPVIFANADLRDVSGWKSQIEAAERLAQTGALPANQLLGIYSKRQPAASGGVWDRVAAVQRFETAQNTASADAISKTLPKAWNHMQSAQLGVPFSALFADRLLNTQLPENVHDEAFAVVQSGMPYEAAGQSFPKAAAKHRFRTGVATGVVDPARAETDIEIAVARGFGDNAADASLLRMAKNGELGMALLRNLSILHAGSQGDMGQLSTALATFRALGLEDAARRAALQLLIGQATQ